MKKSHSLLLSALLAVTVFSGVPARADNMASIAITPATGAVTLAPHWTIGGNLAGFHQMSQNLGLTGSVANNFYSITKAAIPSGGNTLAFNFYVPGSGSATPHADIGSKLTPDSYSALTSADPDVGYGSVNFYFIHHKGTTDYFSVIVPGSLNSSAVTDLKPMSGPGGPGTITGVSGYFGLAFAAADLGYGLNNFYYLRTDPVTGLTRFGTLAPALLASSADQFTLAQGGHSALVFTGTDVGYGTDQMYYLRLDPVTGFTILGTLNPALAGLRHTADIANLGSVYSTMNFVPGDVGYGTGQFYVTGAVNPTWQSVSFAAIADRAISAGAFNVNPTASSALPIVLTVASGSVGAASIVNAGGGVFTVTPTAPGLITLQATQAGQAAPAAPVYESNMLRQSFTITGVATLAITTQPSAQSAVTGTTATFSVVASGTTALTYQWRKAGTNITGNASATTATLTLANAQGADQASYDVAVTNASGTIFSNAVALTVTAPAPVITNSPLTAGGTVGSAFSFTITASNSPTGFAASPLPAGLAFNAATGVISGTPTVVGPTSVTLGATNGTGTGNATLVITIAAVATTATPGINNSPLTAAGRLGSAFSFTISASGSPSSFTANPLPAGLTLNAATGAITGTPTAIGVTAVLLGATNGGGTDHATLTITISAAALAPVITLQPVNQTVSVGQNTTFTVTGGLPHDPAETYLWQRLPAGSTTWLNLFEGGSYRGVTTATLTVNSATPAMSGDQFRCVVVNATDFTASTAVRFTVTGGTDALFQYPASIAMDSVGDFYVVDTLGNIIRKVTATGLVTTLAGTVGQSGSVDGTGAAARFNGPDSVAVDAAGNVYVTDTGNATIRKITPAGVVTTLAGTAGVRGSSDATGSAASFGSPAGIAVDSAGNLYVADTSNSTIRKITPAGVVTTLAGQAGATGSADGTGSAARFNAPRGVTVSTTGNVYVADAGNGTIRKITPAGVVTTIAGQAGTTGTADGLGAGARFNQPYGVFVDATGNVYVADTGNDTIRAVTAGGAVTTLAGRPGIAGLTDGAGSSALFNLPHGLVVSAGTVYVADTGNSTIRQVSTTNLVGTQPMTASSTGTTPGTPTTPPATTTPPKGGGGGGGAVSPWALGLLALLGASRLRAKAIARPTSV